MDRSAHKRLIVKWAALAALLALAARMLILGGQPALGAEASNRSLTISNSQVSQITSYKVGFGITTAGTLGSIRIQFCSNNPLIGYPCTAPDGFDVSAATLSPSDQTGETGFSVDSADTTANVLVLTRTPSAASVGDVSYTLDNITNPSAEGSYYARVETFATTDGSGSDTDYGGLAFAINSLLQINTEVPPFIIFCAAVTIPAYNCGGAQGNLVNLGNLGTKSTGSGQSQILVATNAGNGYSLYMQGNTLTSGNFTINSLNSPSFALEGTDEFGLNLRANLSPAVGQDPAGPGSGVPTSGYDQPNKYKFVNGDVIAGSAQPEDYRRYTVSYIADVNTAQAAGVYVSTITYVATGNF